MHGWDSLNSSSRGTRFPGHAARDPVSAQLAVSALRLVEKACSALETLLRVETGFVQRAESPRLAGFRRARDGHDPMIESKRDSPLDGRLVTREIQARKSGGRAVPEDDDAQVVLSPHAIARESLPTLEAFLRAMDNCGERTAAIVPC